MNEEEDDPVTLDVAGPEMREILGMFDLPAFARRGQDLEAALHRLEALCRRKRDEHLEMVRLRLRQWAGAVAGPDWWRGSFAAPIDHLWPQASAGAPVWAAAPAPARRRRAIARDLVASIERFNARWDRFLSQLNLDPINRMIENYNHYYVFEKECVLRSARLAARHFEPRRPVTLAELRERHAALVVPVLIS